MIRLIPTKSNPVPVCQQGRLHGVNPPRKQHPETCPLWLKLVAIAAIAYPYVAFECLS